MPIDRVLLSRGLAALSLPTESPLADRLARYLDHIDLLNPRLGLVAATPEELIVKHALDSLAPLAIFDDLAAEALREREARGDRSPLPSLADLGSGAGLPGIPLAIARPAWRVTLIDRMTRRIHFLESMRTDLELDNVDILEEQVERAKGSFDLVTFRAFRPFERKLFKKVFGLCAPTGRVLAYKGQMEKARSELAAVEGLFSAAEIRPIRVPFLDEERCLVILKPAAR